MYSKEEMMAYQNVWDASRMCPQYWDNQQSQLKVKFYKEAMEIERLEQLELIKKTGGKKLSKEHFTFGNGIHVSKYFTWKKMSEMYRKYIEDVDLGGSDAYKRVRVLNLLLHKGGWNDLQKEVIEKNYRYQIEENSEGGYILSSNSYVLDGSAKVHKYWSGKDWKNFSDELGLDVEFSYNKKGSLTVSKKKKKEIIDLVAKEQETVHYIINKEKVIG